MRPASLLGAATATNAPASSGANASAGTGSGSSSTSTGGQSATANSLANQIGFRPSSQNFRDFGMEIYGTPGVLEEGTMVRQRQELIRLPDVSKMLAEIKVEEARVSQVRPGMTAYVELRNVPHHRFKGTVRRVALLPDAQAAWLNPEKKVFPTDIIVDEELPILKPGVSANVEIVITNLPKVLSVPIQTVTRVNGENVCFIKKGSRVTPVPVMTGWYNDAFVEVTSGLKEGDLVLLAPVGDKEEEEPEETEGGETNKAPQAPPPARPATMEEPPGEGRGFRRRDSQPADGDAPSDRPRNRQGSGRRTQNSQNGPE
jgi:hypothetical protein